MDRNISRRDLLKGGSRLALASGVSLSCAETGLSAEPIREYRRGGMLYRRLGATELNPHWMVWEEIGKLASTP